MAPLVKISSTS
nr:unnamed protein product [Callosobruchus analis]